jgi:hypothetical protein
MERYFIVLYVIITNHLEYIDFSIEKFKTSHETINNLHKIYLGINIKSLSKQLFEIKHCFKGNGNLVRCAIITENNVLTPMAKFKV